MNSPSLRLTLDRVRCMCKCCVRGNGEQEKPTEKKQQTSPVIRNLRPIEFSIEGRDNYVDLSQSYFEIKGKLTLATGGEILDNTKLIPVSNLGHSMIKQIKLLLNGSLITDASDDYAYKAYIETLLNFHKEAQDSYLKLCGWYHHGGFVQAITDNQMDDATPHEAYSALDRDVQATLKEARQARENFFKFGWKRCESI